MMSEMHGGCVLAARFDLGFGNPNVSAVLLASLVIALLAPALLLSGRWRWVSIAGAGLVALPLLATGSRGGLLGLACGLCALGWMHRSAFMRGVTRRPRAAAALGMAAVVLLVGFVLRDSRLSRWGDDSIGNRWVIYQTIPTMLHAAPWGWGFGKGAHAWHNWFQPMDRFEEYKNLVSTHVTWCVEGGWLFTWAYLALWSFVMTLCWPGSPATSQQPGFLARVARSGTPFAMCAAFFVSASTTHIGPHGPVWVLPLVGVLVCAAAKPGGAKARRAAVLGGLAGLVVTGVAVVAGACLNDPRIELRGRSVMVGHPPASAAIVAWDRKVDGGRAGKLARAWHASHRRTVTVVRGLDDLAPPGPMDTVWILGGSDDLSSSAVRAKEIKWVNPPDSSAAVEFAAALAAGGCKITVYWGALRNASTKRWKAVPGLGAFVLLPGVADFVGSL